MVSKQNPTFSNLSSGLKDLFKYKNWSALWQTYILARQWQDIVGKKIAQKSEPAYIQQDTLWIYVDSSVLMQHMQPQKLSLLEKINLLLPEADINDIRWAMRPARPVRAKQSATERKVLKPSPEERNAFEEMAATLEDKACRKALLKLWETYHN